MIVESAQRDALVALASLPGFGARRLRAVIAHGDPAGEWERVVDSRPLRSVVASTEERNAWRAAAAAVLAGQGVAARHRAAGVTVTVLGDAEHPTDDPADPHVPPVLFWRGAVPHIGAGVAPAVGIIGTRRATRYGFDLARELGYQLADVGICVVSGLAAGIDAAAHRGALDALATTPPGGGSVLAVVGTGLDVPYPACNRSLWAEVASAGSIVSEYPLGTPPAAWRFPARNRILAALCAALVVVESHERGGSLITADIAGARGVPVLAVPGPVRSSSSRGTNRLIADGCQPCLGIDDVLDALGLVGVSQPRARSAAAGPDVTGNERTVLDALGWQRRTLTDLASACPHLSLAELTIALASLLDADVVVVADGCYERAG